MRIFSIPKTTAVMPAAASSSQNHNKLPRGKRAVGTLEIHKSLLIIHKQRSTLIA